MTPAPFRAGRFLFQGRSILRWTRNLPQRHCLAFEVGFTFLARGCFEGPF